MVAVVDLFCGIGGFSCGASRAGGRTVIAIDSEPNIAQLYAENNGNHVLCAELGPSMTETLCDLLTPLTAYHIHASPPCQNLSVNNTVSKKEHVGMRHVKWYIDLVERAKPKSWSMEQVNHEKVRSLLERKRIPYVVVNCVNFDVPQSRRRLIAGSDHIVQALAAKEYQGPTVLPVNVLTSLTPPAAYTLANATDNQPVRKIMNGMRVTVGSRPNHAGEFERDLWTPAHTVTTNPGKVLCARSGSVVRRLTPFERARLQGFDESIVLSGKVTLDNTVVGNAIPPPLAAYITEAAVSHLKR